MVMGLQISLRRLFGGGDSCAVSQYIRRRSIQGRSQADFRKENPQGKWQREPRGLQTAGNLRECYFTVCSST